jgi:prepilin-type N-terminal cleavage/methylation domain-containing protein
MRRDNRTREAGFSLMEIVVVMVLVAIVSLLALPRFVSPKASLAARRLAADIQYAKELAIRLQTKSGVYFMDSSTYRVFQDDDVSKAAFDPVTGGNFEVSISGLFSDATVDSSFGNVLKFDALGTPLDGSDAKLTSPPINEITITSGAETWTITVEPNTGKVTLP